jgi:hypothetical protein
MQVWHFFPVKRKPAIPSKPTQSIVHFGGTSGPRAWQTATKDQSRTAILQ